MNYLITICTTNVMRMGCFVVILLIVFCWSIEYQIQGMDNDKRLGEKNEISLSLFLSPSLSFSLSPCVCTYLYIRRCSFPSNLNLTFTFTFTYTKFQITAFPIILYLTLTLRPYTKPHFPIISSHPMHTFTYVLYCTVSTICRQYLRGT